MTGEGERGRLVAVGLGPGDRKPYFRRAMEGLEDIRFEKWEQRS